MYDGTRGKEMYLIKRAVDDCFSSILFILVLVTRFALRLLVETNEKTLHGLKEKISKTCLYLCHVPVLCLEIIFLILGQMSF